MAAGKGQLFDLLKENQVPTKEMAARFGISDGAIRVTVHRLRQRYKELLREEVAHTVSDPAEMDDELRHLLP